MSNVVTRVLLAWILPLALGCGSKPPDVVRIDGSAGVAPLLNALVTEYRTKHPRAGVIMGTGLGSSERLLALAENRIDIAMASHGVNEGDLQRRGMISETIARTPVMFAVNSSVPVAALTRQQICDVFSGKIVNWRQLGGPDLEIKAGMRPRQEVDAEVVLEGVPCLGKPQFGPRVQMIMRPDDMARAISVTPGAIGITSGTLAHQSGGRIRAIALDGVAPSAENVAAATYPLTRASILVYRKPTRRAVLRFLQFIRSPDGERVIRANGALPISGPS